MFVAAGWIGQTPAPPQRGTPLEQAIVAAYQREFHHVIQRPALHDDPTNGGCSFERHITTTAYLRQSAKRSTLLLMYLTPDGGKVLRREITNVLTPAGTINVLSLLIRYPQTIGEEGVDRWKAAQRQINDDHDGFARKRGYRAPLVTFANTNLVVEREEVANPQSYVSVREAVQRHGLSISAYDLVMTIDLNPTRPDGGFASPQYRLVYVGNYASWKHPLGPQEWRMVAKTAYHHELAHHWGWDHDWSPSCGGTTRAYDPFLAPPSLFGWEDVDGDTFPEIVDETPYAAPPGQRQGRSKDQQQPTRRRT